MDAYGTVTAEEGDRYSLGPPNNMSKLYEIHITTYTSHSEKASLVAKALHWKTSEIARDPVLGNDTYFYLTKYAESKEIAMIYLDDAVTMLLCCSVPVVREKIEHIVHDIRHIRK